MRGERLKSMSQVLIATAAHSKCAAPRRTAACWSRRNLLMMSRRRQLKRRFVVVDHHRLPQIDALELVAVVDLNAGAADQVLQCQVAPPAQLRAQWARPLFQ